MKAVALRRIAAADSMMRKEPSPLSLGGGHWWLPGRRDMLGCLYVRVQRCFNENLSL